MFDKLRQALIVLTASGEKRASQQLVRKASVMAAKLLRGTGDVAGKLAQFEQTVMLHETETSSWVPPEALREGRSGPFDACDLRHWLVLADLAGVPFVPAREILSLEEHEMERLSGQVEIPETAAVRSVRKNLHLLPSVPDEVSRDAPPIDMEELVERLHSAMDGVPEGWMVRSARCGSSELKSLAGAGAAGPTVPEVRFGPDLEIGPGWIRTGNRRRVHVSDARTVESAAQGPGKGSTFLARPWMEAARYAVGEDPHRHGTPFAGKGMWPAEWRAFVEGGEVVGVSSYYGWCGSADAENARVAIRVREMAQAISDKAAALGAWPRYMDVEFVRASRHPDLIANERIVGVLDLLGREAVSCTLDFLETAEGGLRLLEGGPPNTPFGGGHPCAFAGCGGLPKFGNKTDVSGVAFRIMPHVSLADPSTWADGDRTDCILSWDEAAALAADGPKP